MATPLNRFANVAFRPPAKVLYIPKYQGEGVGLGGGSEMLPKIDPLPANFRRNFPPEIPGWRFYRELKPRFKPAFSHFTLFWLNFPRRWLASHCYRAAAGKIPNQNLGQQT